MEIEQLMLQTAAVVPLDEGEDPGAQKAGSGITLFVLSVLDAEERLGGMSVLTDWHFVLIAEMFFFFPEHRVSGEFSGAFDTQFLLDPVSIGADCLDAEFHAFGNFSGRQT